MKTQPNNKISHRAVKEQLLLRLSVIAVVLTAVLPIFAINDGIGDPTRVPSSVRSGLHRSPQVEANATNKIITGNVAGGKHFRDTIPYTSVYEFQDTLGTDSLKSFYRNSAPIYVGHSSTLSPQPYYLPSSVVGSSNARLRGQLDYSENYVTSTPRSTTKFGNTKIQQPAVSPLYNYNKTRPISDVTSQLQTTLDYEIRQQIEKTETQKAIQNIISQKSNLNEEDDNKATSENFLRAQPAKIANQTNILSKPVERDSVPEKILEPGSKKTVYEQMLEQIAQPMLQQEQEKAETQEDETEDVTDLKDSEFTSSKSRLSEISAEIAEVSVGIHKSFATDSKDKFNYYMRTAEDFLAVGKYYRAADAYSLASIYNPSDPLAYAGRSHALFASGEYMSSAYFLIKAIDMFPEYVQMKIDIQAMIPDKDKLENRIADVKKWLEKNNSPQLALLLAYIYHQLDKDEFAIEPIKFANDNLPNNTAVMALKKVIEK